MSLAAAAVPRSSSTGDALTRIAVAEALHVDGRYAESARLWTGLAAEGVDVQMTALKAAVAFYSMGSRVEGDAWIARARSAGAQESELLTVEGQRARLAGELERAKGSFERAMALNPGGASDALNGLGVTLWQLGDRDAAGCCFELALGEHPCDGLARTNAGRLALDEGRYADATLALAQGAAHAPHRPEPFVLASRLARRLGDGERARELLIKARLRRAIPADRPSQATTSTPIGRVRLRATIREDRLVIEGRYELQPGRPLPLTFTVNRGYERVACHTPSGWVDLPASTDDLEPRLRHLCTVRVPTEAWMDACVLELRVEGMPVPPCVRIERDWLELAGESGWLPIPTPPAHWHWDDDLDLPARFRVFRSSEPSSTNGGAFIALASPAKVGRTFGNVPHPHLAHADRVATRALCLWDDLAGRLDRSPPPIVVLDRPTSTFCYTRPGFVRLASGILERPGQSAIVYHEIGHLWWGAGAHFHPDSAWLAESLAEYTLHLAEDDGALPGYRADALRALRALGKAELPATGLAELAGATGHENAFILRAKGGFLVSMLREVIGEHDLRRTLHEALRTQGELDAYTFFALAAWFHGATLDWFVNQWVFSSASMRFELGPLQIDRTSGGHEVHFTVSTHGVATPGAPIELAIALEDGTEHRLAVRLETGHADVDLTLPARPLHVTIDPNHRWYATVAHETTRTP